MNLVFYDCRTAPSPRRARILLAEKRVPHTVEEVDLAGGAQFSEAFRRINPDCTVPVLVTPEDGVLTDNAGIAAWLEARYPEPPLFGVHAAELAQVASWHFRAEHEGLMAVGEALRNGSPAMANRALPGPVNYPQIPALAERGRLRIRQFFDTLEARLRDHRYLAGENFSIADVTAVVAVDFARVVRLRPDPERHAQLLRWRETLSQRPSIGP